MKKNPGKPSEIKHIILTNTIQDKPLSLEDTDIWGLQCSLQHCIDCGYAKENLVWFEKMYQALDSMRDGVL